MAPNVYLYIYIRKYAYLHYCNIYTFKVRVDVELVRHVIIVSARITPLFKKWKGKQAKPQQYVAIHLFYLCSRVHPASPVPPR